MPGDSGDGDGVSGQSRLVESLVNDLVEFRFCSSGEEGVKLRDFILTLIKLFKYELEDLVARNPLLAMRPPLIKSMPICGKLL
jgi:hypothetical protein